MFFVRFKIKNIFSLWFLAGFVIGALLFARYYIASEIESSKLQKKIIPKYTKEVLEKPKEIKEEPQASQAAKIRFPIIMYHYIEYVKDPNDTIRRSLTINPALFEYQLKNFKEANYQMYFVREIPDILSGQIKTSTRSAALTFDDGYEDFYTNAFPLLKKYQTKATLYIVANFVGRRGFLNEMEIKELLTSGLVEIGSHTFDHAYLKRANPAYARRQIVDSKKKLEDEFGVQIKTFAYPYGAFDNSALDLVKQASYSAAVAVISGTIQSEGNIFFLSRLRPGFLAGPKMIGVMENFPK